MTEPMSRWTAVETIGRGMVADPGLALAIVAEIQTTFAAAAGESLRERKTPIHLASGFAAALR